MSSTVMPSTLHLLNARIMLLSCLLDLALEQCVKALIVYFDDLPANAGEISLGLSHGAANRLHKDLIVLIDHLLGAIARHECGDLLAVFHQLDSHALPHGG